MKYIARIIKDYYALNIKEIYLHKKNNKILFVYKKQEKEKRKRDWSSKRIKVQTKKNTSNRRGMRTMAPSRRRVFTERALRRVSGNLRLRYTAIKQFAVALVGSARPFERRPRFRCIVSSAFLRFPPRQELDVRIRRRCYVNTSGPRAAGHRYTHRNNGDGEVSAARSPRWLSRSRFPIPDDSGESACRVLSCRAAPCKSIFACFFPSLIRNKVSRVSTVSRAHKSTLRSAHECERVGFPRLLNTGDERLWHSRSMINT